MLPSKIESTCQHLSGWGRSCWSKASVVHPKTVDDVKAVLEYAKRKGKSISFRGAGLSYGDVTLNEDNVTVDLSGMNRIIEWDPTTGILLAEPGVTVAAVLKRCLEDGWILRAVPGTRWLTLGGAASNNVHGKNCYRDGNFGEGILSLRMILPSGEMVVCSPSENRELFTRVIGGGGLLGAIVELKLQLMKVPSPYLLVEKYTARNIDELIDSMESRKANSNFLVAHIDSSARGAGIGRGTVHAASFIQLVKHARASAEYDRKAPRRPSLLFRGAANVLINDANLVNLAQRAKYRLDAWTSRRDVRHFMDFNFLLDKISFWPHLFRSGILQQEALFPEHVAAEGIRGLLEMTHRHRIPAYLAGVKVHRADTYPLSFAMEGYSIALDFPIRPRQRDALRALTQEMNGFVGRLGGKMYLAKDQTLSKSVFREMYPRVGDFERVKNVHDSERLFQSNLYRRLMAESSGGVGL